MDKIVEKINGIEVFAAGEWNGDKYTSKDLDEMVKAFEETKHRIKPAIKLGHDDNQFLVQQGGYPAAGWINNLYRKGEKLMADVIDIPDKIFQLIKNKAYRKVSSEIYWNIKIDGKSYGKLLSAVALLGDQLPAVTSLDDILAWYGLDPADARIYSFDNKHKHEIDFSEGEPMTEEIKNEETKEEVVAENATPETVAEQAKPEDTKKYSDMEAQIKKLEETNAELKTKTEETDKLLSEHEADKIKAENDKFLGELENDKLITAASKVYVEQLLSEDKKEYEIAEKKLSKKEIIKEIFSLHKEASKVNFDENSEDVIPKVVDKDEVKEINEYAEKHDLSFRDAYVEVEKNKKTQE